MTRGLVDACVGKPVERTPVWMMRQAGRYLPEYRDIRKKHSLLDICAHPDVAAEVTLQPLKRFDFDAAIIFADILLPLVPMGVELEFVEGVGPVIGNPINSEADVMRLRPLEPDDSLAPTLEALRIVRGELDDAVSLIGFAGAPFTLASYLIEGGPSKDFRRTKAFLLREPAAFRRLLALLAEAMSAYLQAQVRAGADVIQLFDSWVGCLTPDDYRDHVLPHSRRVLTDLRATGAPSIHFGVGTATLLPLMKTAGSDVIGLDWRTPLDQGWHALETEDPRFVDRTSRVDGTSVESEVETGESSDTCTHPSHAVAVQGNLDPVALFGPHDEIERRTHDILRRAGGRSGHIFNLGHGVLPTTPIDAVERMVQAVREYEDTP